ncbi:hypothetical protein GQ42DRAFT_179539 [Ramicandelaber brevisporus]|nr:hypothetical protein GQ42DRAFT_179539 [Ramicandelaber brevisporus]
MKTDNPEYKSLLVDYMPEGEYMIGYYIDKEYYGRGIMTGVVKAVTERVLNGIVDDTVFDKERDHVDQVVRVPRLNAEYYEGNMGSLRVLIKNGFVEQEKCSIRIWRASGCTFFYI